MIVSMIKNLIRWSVLNAFSTDDKQFPIHQVEYLGKTANAMAWWPYGFHANPGKETLGIILAIGSNAENRVVLPGSPKERISDLLPTPLKNGELLIYHPLTKSFIHFLEDGSITVQSVTDLTLNVAGNALIDVEGNLDVDAAGTVDVDAVGDITLTAPSVDVNGDMAIVGDITLTGNFIETGDFSNVGNALVGSAGTVNLGGTGGPAVSRLGDNVAHPEPGGITSGSANVFAVD